MGHANNIITAPINVEDDLGYVLGTASGDVGTLYNHASVNKWSRKKPVPWSVNGVKTLNPQGDYPSSWWQGRDGNFGLVAKSADTTNVLSFIDGDLNGWTYSRDTLAFRAMDFDGYYQNAPNPFDSLFLQADKVAVTPGGTLTFQYQLSSSGHGTDYSLGIPELKSGLNVGGVQKYISDMYAAFIIYKQGSGGTYSYYDWCSASQTLSDLETDPAMHSVAYTAPTETGTYKYVPVITVAQKEQSAQAIGSFITIPGTTSHDFTIATNVNPYMQVDACVYSESSQNPNYNNTIYFFCTFFGGTNGGQFNNISLVFETEGGVGYMTLTNVQNGGTSGALSVAANSSTRKPAGGGNWYSVTWTPTAQSLENFIMNGGYARIFAQSGSGIESYRVRVYPSAAAPSGTVTPF